MKLERKLSRQLTVHQVRHTVLRRTNTLLLSGSMQGKVTLSLGFFVDSGLPNTHLFLVQPYIRVWLKTFSSGSSVFVVSGTLGVPGET